MSDDVRARAEALLGALEDTRYHGIEIGALGDPMRALRAALAAEAADASASPVDATTVAPATGDAAAVREACAKLCDEVAAEDTADEREADDAGDDQLSAMARESVRTATYLAETIRALPLPAPATAVVGSVSDQGPDEGPARVEEARSDDRPAKGQGGV